MTDEKDVNIPEGMRLYALCEMRYATPNRKFVFANSEEDDAARLEIIAQGFDIVDSETPLSII